MSVEILLGALALLAGVAALVVAWRAWKRPSIPDPRSVPTFAGQKIGHGQQGRDFLDFLDRHKGRKVFIDIWFDSREFPELTPEVKGERTWLAATGFTIRDESNRMTPNNRVWIDVAEPQASQLTYTSGAWKLHGYFAVRGIVPARMSVVERVLVPISLKEAVN